MKAMVLAAGVGSRLEPLTNQVPKPMVPIANRPVMEHMIALLQRNGINEIISNLHYLPDQIADYFGDGSAFGVRWHAILEKELSGDAGGVRACRKYFDSTFIVLMGDLLTDADVSYVIETHKKKGALASIAVKQVPDVEQFGVVVRDKQGFIKQFQEKPRKEEALSNYASTGIYVLEPEIFKHIPEQGTYGFGRQLFPSLVEKGLPVLGIPIDDYYWSDVGTIKQYRISNCDALSGKVDIKIPGTAAKFGYAEAGAVVADGVAVEGKLLVGKNSRIESGVRIKGHVIVGDNCRIGRGAYLEDTIVWADSNIGREAVLRNCVVGYNCTVGDGTTQNEMASVPLSAQLL